MLSKWFINYVHTNVGDYFASNELQLSYQVLRQVKYYICCF